MTFTSRNIFKGLIALQKVRRAQAHHEKVVCLPRPVRAMTIAIIPCSSCCNFDRSPGNPCHERSFIRVHTRMSLYLAEGLTSTALPELKCCYWYCMFSEGTGVKTIWEPSCLRCWCVCFCVSTDDFVFFNCFRRKRPSSTRGHENQALCLSRTLRNSERENEARALLIEGKRTKVRA